MLKNTKQGYGAISMMFHWLSAIVVFGLFAVGWYMVELTYFDELYRVLPHWHKSIGILFILITVMRFVWIKMNPKPTAIGTDLEQKVASIAHGVFYLLLVTLFISGYLISTADGRGIDVFEWFTVPGFGSFIENQEDIAGLVHEYVAYALIGLAVVHALAAIKHHFINKDKTLLRMIKNHSIGDSTN